MCPCGSEYATVRVSTSEGSELVGRHCAALLEMIGRLWGLEAKRRPALGIVRGSVE